MTAGFMGTVASLALTTVFTAAKLAGAISWHWVWVVSPMWLPMALMFAAGLLFVFFILVKDMIAIPFDCLAQITDPRYRRASKRGHEERED